MTKSTPKNLVIVESPAKAKTIEKYLGSDYEVMSSYGHIRDLPKEEMAIDLQNNYEPTYVIDKNKEKLVNELKKHSKKAEMVYLASDDDREGEAISWHLGKVLELNDNKVRRIVFREITKNAIINALQNPREIDINLVNAQQARRVLDRIVGYELSPILWKKINRGLSAGRVQSVAVRIVVEREREISKFLTHSSFKVTAFFKLEKNVELKAELQKKLNTDKEILAFLEKCKNATFKIDSIEKKPHKKSPVAPFTTSTLQQEASRKLGYPVAKTMLIAQRLYESGKISYMRTDSINLSDEAISNIKKEVISQYGEKYSNPRKFKNKNQNAQEAHEAIRPTDFSIHDLKDNKDQANLYSLIWKRTVASQMADAELEKTTVTISISSTNEHFYAVGEVVVFDGFMKVYTESSDDDEHGSNTSLPPLTQGQKLDLKNILAKETFTRHPPRYTEASLVKKLEELGIGRPSTYAPTISTIIKREYVEKDSREGKERSVKMFELKNNNIIPSKIIEIYGAEKNKLFPTNTGIVVNDFLNTQFQNVVDYDFTAHVEQEFDEIAHGNKDWVKMIDNFYHDFHPKVEETNSINRSDVESKSRLLGKDPISGKEVHAKYGKFGGYVQLGNLDDEEKPRNASLRKGQFIENITLDEAMKLFELPRSLGTFEDKEMIVNVGRFGPYVKYDNLFVSIKNLDPYEISEEQAIELILEKREQELNKYIKTFNEDPDIQVLNGRFGPYIKAGKKNVKIPKGTKAEDLTLEECKKLASEAPEKKKRWAGNKKK